MDKFKPSNEVKEILGVFGIELEVTYLPTEEGEIFFSVEGKREDGRWFYIGTYSDHKNYLVEFDVVKDWHMSHPFRSEMLTAIAHLLDEIKEFKIKEKLKVVLGKLCEKADDG